LRSLYFRLVLAMFDSEQSLNLSFSSAYGERVGPAAGHQPLAAWSMVDSLIASYITSKVSMGFQTKTW